MSRSRIIAAGVALAVLAGTGYLGWTRVADRSTSADRLTSTDRPTTTAGDLHVAWPAQGQAAVAVSGRGLIGTSGSHRPAPIASLAKVMTAYVVLALRPIGTAEDGFTLTVTPDQVADTTRRRARGESLVAVEAGERLTERQALQALLLPSANNVSAILATETAGSGPAFVQLMNRQAHLLGMRATTYTDPSGFDPGTVSTAADQLVLARAAMRLPVLASIVALRTATIPVAGAIQNTDRLLGRDGFIGTKTGSHDAAGGCFMFLSAHHIAGRDVVIAGVVLGQRGGPLIDVALASARAIVDGIVGQLQAR